MPNQIRIIKTQGVHPSHGLTPGRVFEVIGSMAEPMFPGMQEDRVIRGYGYYVMGDCGIRVLVLRGECEVVEPVDLS